MSIKIVKNERRVTIDIIIILWRHEQYLKKNGSRVKTWSHTITSPCYYTSQIFYTRYKGLHRPPTLTNQSYLSLFETSRRVVVSWATVQKGQVDSTATISFFFFSPYIFSFNPVLPQPIVLILHMNLISS